MILGLRQMSVGVRKIVHRGFREFKLHYRLCQNVDTCQCVRPGTVKSLFLHSDFLKIGYIQTIIFFHYDSGFSMHFSVLFQVSIAFVHLVKFVFLDFCTVL